jgi:hypothetical protein
MKSVDQWVGVHNGTVQNGNVTKRYVYKMELVTEQYKLHNRMCEKTVHYKTVRVQNGTFYRTVRVTQRDV